MSVQIHVTKIEAIGEGKVLASVVAASELGPIELEVEGDLTTDAEAQDPLIHALGEVRDKLLAFAAELRVEMKDPDILTRMVPTRTGFSRLPPPASACWAGSEKNPGKARAGA
jgi:hypothetical protein